MGLPRLTAGVIGGAAVIALVAAGYLTTRAEAPKGATTPRPPEPASESPSDFAAPSAEAPPEPRAEAPPAARAADPKNTPPPFVSHSADPCHAISEQTVPEGYEVVTALGITVASQPGEPVLNEPTAFAHLVAGLLEEAALLTGTARRDRLTVIRYTSSESFHKLTRAPSWADGIYDGAVKLPADSRADFGVLLRTLRHELMHAQLHAGVGCTPFWLNEGAAMQFGGKPPQREWIRILRERRLIDPDSLEGGTFEELSTSDLDVAYGQSLAMVLFMTARRGAIGIAEALRELDVAATQPLRPGRQGLWARLYPSVGRREIADSLAQRIFKVPQGPELDGIFAGAVCCYGQSSISELGCRGAPLNPGKHFWVDKSREPRAYCEVD
jgi:hypothetical protein